MPCSTQSPPAWDTPKPGHRKIYFIQTLLTFWLSLYCFIWISKLPEKLGEGQQETKTTSFDSCFGHEADPILLFHYESREGNGMNDLHEKTKEKIKYYKTWKKTCLKPNVGHGVWWCGWGGWRGSSRRTRGGGRSRTRTSEPAANTNIYNNITKILANIFKICKY